MKKLLKTGLCFLLCLSLLAVPVYGGSSFSLLYEEVAGEITITGFSGTMPTTLCLPDTMEGLPVTAIGPQAFEGCHGLRTVSLPKGLKTIGDEAFYDCPQLTYITLPQSLTAIGGLAFYGCSNLVVSVFDNGQYLGTEDNPHFALINVVDPSVKEMAVHKDTCLLSDTAFYFASGLERIEAGEDSLNFADDGRGVLLSRGGTCVLAAPRKLSGKYQLPNTVQVIGDHAFAFCDQLTEVYGSGTLREIGEGAFYQCTALQTVEPGTGLHSLGAEAFYGCTGLKDVTLPDSLRRLGTDAFTDCSALLYRLSDNGLYLGNSKNPYHVLVKVRNQELTACTVHKDTVVIGANAFFACHQLKSVTLPKGLKTIDDYAFDDCYTLTGITLPGVLETIGEGAFSWCLRLGRLNIPDSVTAIGARAFASCVALRAVTLPSGVAVLREGTFAFCTALETVALGDGLRAIEKEAFHCCTALTAVTLPQSVSALGAGAFSDCTGLDSVCFLGEPPVLEQEIFRNVTVTVCVPGGSEGWQKVIEAGTGDDGLTWVQGHAFGTYQDNGDADCHHDGTQTALCQYCGCESTLTLPSSGGHRYENGVCLRCGEKRFLPGDINGDGRLTMVDMARLYAHIKGTTPITDPEVLQRGDVMEDGKINIRDAAILYAQIRGI